MVGPARWHAFVVVSKLAVPVQVPELAGVVPEVYLDASKLQLPYSFETENRIVSLNEKHSVAGGNRSVPDCSSASSLAPLMASKRGVHVVPSSFVNGRLSVPQLNCSSVLLPSVVAAGTQAQAKTKTSPDVNLEEFEMLDSTPFHRLELKTLNEMDELGHMLTRTITVSNGDLNNGRKFLPGKESQPQ
uniref:Uncharacterized protein n=1 Tax=Trichuris muris TaxID=70415 RepID=A0A5S6QN51_TRIMR